MVVEYLVEHRLQERHIVRLPLVRVGEEHVRLVWNQVRDGDFLDTNNDICL